ncbi:MAG TPA: DUF1080 domain-containing protein [Chthoniobacteraceae bacterium]|jgi:hypothetical protein|nr:DUF1080 domain-containing protein [Chthoniobacteraceae bacterium]
MKKLLLLALLSLSTTVFAEPATSADGFISLFDGKTLDGWKASEKEGSFSVQDGKIVVFGPRSHLFYNGEVKNHDFKNFILRCQVMTFPGANSGFYFHTAYQDVGFPDKGFEVQVNNTHKDPKKTAGLYNIKDNFEAPAKDEEWFRLEIIVEGKHVVTKVNDKVITDWTQEGDAGPEKQPNRKIDHGTFAIQGHDPGSKVYFKDIQVKPLE